MYLQPFQEHPADVAALRQHASELLARASEAAELAEATRTAYRPAIGNWDGMGAAELVAAGEPVQGEAQTMRQDLAWGAGVGQYWAGQVEGFNTEVKAITAGLSEQAGHDYGATGTDGSPPTAGQIADARAAATAAAKQQWMQAHATWIEDGRMRGSAMLRDGPTEAHLLELREAGVLPANAFDPLPDIWGAAKNLVLPPAVLGSLGIPALAANLGLTGLGVVSQWATFVKRRFQTDGVQPIRPLWLHHP